MAGSAISKVDPQTGINSRADNENIWMVNRLEQSEIDWRVQIAEQ